MNESRFTESSMTIYGVNSERCVRLRIDLLSGVCVWYVSLVSFGKLKCMCMLTSLLKRLESHGPRCGKIVVSYSLRV